MDILVYALVLIMATVGIGALCYSWMKSTRASQRKVEAQNERIIALLEAIAASSGDSRVRDSGGEAGTSPETRNSERINA